MPDEKQLVALIGDIVGSRSRSQANRAGLQRRLLGVLAEANALLQPAQPLEVGIGDEFQGGFSEIAEATLASLVIRLMLLGPRGGVDSRYGLGRGAVTVFDPTRSPVSQDGPAWWAARTAIERAKLLSLSPRTSFVRTCFGEGAAVPRRLLREERLTETALESFLFCRDALVDHMTARQQRLLHGLLLGATQAELAAVEQITQGAVSQSLNRSGAFAIEASQRQLGAMLS